MSSIYSPHWRQKNNNSGSCRQGCGPLEFHWGSILTLQFSTTRQISKHFLNGNWSPRGQHCWGGGVGEDLGELYLFSGSLWHMGSYSRSPFSLSLYHVPIGLIRVKTRLSWYAPCFILSRTFKELAHESKDMNVLHTSRYKHTQMREHKRCYLSLLLCCVCANRN